MIPLAINAARIWFVRAEFALRIACSAAVYAAPADVETAAFAVAGV
jgi:hypothetical protein